MSKMIINHHGVATADALDYVRIVVERGRIANGNKQYCPMTSFADGILVYAQQTRSGADTFCVEPTGYEDD